MICCRLFLSCRRFMLMFSWNSHLSTNFCWLFHCPFWEKVVYKIDCACYSFFLMKTLSHASSAKAEFSVVRVISLASEILSTPDENSYETAHRPRTIPTRLHGLLVRLAIGSRGYCLDNLGSTLNLLKKSRSTSSPALTTYVLSYNWLISVYLRLKGSLFVFPRLFVRKHRTLLIVDHSFKFSNRSFGAMKSKQLHKVIPKSSDDLVDRKCTFEESVVVLEWSSSFGNNNDRCLGAVNPIYTS